MKNINAVRIGNTVNISINGKLHKKNCSSPDEANQLFKIILKARENPTDKNIKAIHLFLNEKTRIAMMAGLEADVETGEVYLAGFNTPIPDTLVNVIKEYHENGYPLNAIINFWKLLMINPDIRVRKSLFDFITAHDFVLTDNGYMIVYKAVYKKDEKETDNSFEEFVTNQYLKVRKDWKCSANKYVIYKDFNTDTFEITKTTTAENWNENDLNIEFLGNLGDLFSAIVNNDNKNDIEKIEKQLYTDMYTRTMTIKLGVPVHMPRTECNGDPKDDCGFGLHCGCTSYVNTYANNSSTILVCLVNPANVISVPTHECTKMRVSEYFPYAVASYIDGKIDIIEEAYFESDYCAYELNELEKQIELIQSNELPIETAISAEEETRPMEELMKIIKTRIVDIIEVIDNID